MTNHQRKCWMLFYDVSGRQVTRKRVHARAPLKDQIEHATAFAQLHKYIYFFAIGTEKGNGSHDLQMLTEITLCQ